VEDCTRRVLIARGGAAWAAVTLAPLLELGAAASAAEPAAAGLTVARQATYTSLVEAVGHAGTTQVDASDSERALREFERFYRSGDDHHSTGVENVLDLIEAVPGHGFAAQAPRARLKQLRAWHGSDTAAQLRGRRWSMAAIAPIAVIYAALPFYSHGTDDPPLVVGI
jgi:hypothetical protein